MKANRVPVSTFHIIEKADCTFTTNRINRLLAFDRTLITRCMANSNAAGRTSSAVATNFGPLQARSGSTNPVAHVQF